MEYKTLLGFNPEQVHHAPVKFPDHPEHPKRIFAIRRRLETTGLLELCNVREGVSKFSTIRGG